MTSEPVPGTHLTFKKKLLFICGTILFAVLLAEAALSTYCYFFYPRLIVSDDDMGWIYKQTSGTIKRHDRGGAINETSINSEGFRDTAFEYDENALRIMLLGDSMTFGLEADQEEIYPTLLEKRLQEKLDGTKVDVMNLGITGFTNVQELMCLRKYAPKYHPQVIVLQMSEWNDFEGNTWIYRGRYLPHFKVQDGQYVEDSGPSAFYRVLNFLRDHSTLYYLLTQRTEELFTVAQDLTPQQVTDLTLFVVNEIYQYAKDNDIPFYVLYVRDPKDPTDWLEAIENMFQKEGITYRVIEAVPEERVAGIGHWNGKGHAHATEVIMDMLMSDKVIASHIPAASTSHAPDDEAKAAEN